MSGREPGFAGWPSGSPSATRTGSGSGLSWKETPNHRRFPRRATLICSVRCGNSPAYRAALVLHYYEDWPIAEVASVLGWTVSATKVKLMRARRRLGGLLQEEVGEDVG